MTSILRNFIIPPRIKPHLGDIYEDLQQKMASLPLGSKAAFLILFIGSPQILPSHRIAQAFTITICNEHLQWS